MYAVAAHYVCTNLLHEEQIQLFKRIRHARKEITFFPSLRRWEFSLSSLTLAANVGEDVTIRYDPRDMGEIGVFHEDRFLCRAISAELGWRDYSTA